MTRPPDPRLIVRANCFGSSGKDGPGTYNPRIDLMFLQPDLMIRVDPAAVEVHEGIGHRGFAIQGSLLRAGRHYGGVMYSLIAMLMVLLAETDLHLSGRTLDELRLDNESRISEPALARPGGPQAALKDILFLMRSTHAAMAAFTREIRVVFEIIATAWEVWDLRKRLPPDHACAEERNLLEAQEHDLASYPGAARFRQLYERYQAIEPLGLRLVVGLHAMDICNWSDGRAGIGDRVQRFANLLSSIGVSDAGLLTIVQLRKTRDAERDMYQEWLFRQLILGPLQHVSYECQFPWRLAVLLDYVLYDPIPDGHHCSGVAEECLHEIHKSSLIRIVESRTSLHLSIDQELCQRAFSAKTSEYLRRYSSLGDESSSLATESNPLALDKDWYKWLLLFEMLYQAVMSGEAAYCPFAYSPGAGCDRSCVIRRELSGLQQQSELVSGALCRLVEA